MVSLIPIKHMSTPDRLHSLYNIYKDYVIYLVVYFSVEMEEEPANVIESELETKIMEELDEYVTVDAIHDECLNAAISFG